MAKWVISMISSTSYFGIVFLMFVENVFPPIPSEVIMPLAGYMVTQNQLSFVGVVAAGVAGSVLGALPLYYLGAKIGGDRLKKFADDYGRWLTLSRKDIEGAEAWFKRHGGAAVFFCRLIPGIRSLISIPAGMEKMSLAPFLLYTTIGAGVWTALLATAGYLLGSNFTQAEKYLDPVSWVVLGVIMIAYVVRVIRHKGGKESG